MPMDQAGLEALVAANPDALALVKDLSGKASKLTPELEKDLEALPTLRQTAAAAATLQKDIDNQKAIIADLTEQRKTWKAAGGAAGAPTPEYLALEEKLKAQGESLSALQKAKEDSDKALATSASEKRETDLKSSIVTAASKANATDADDIFILLKARGLTGYKEDGATPFYNKLNDAGQMVACANAGEMVTAFLDKRKDLVKGSGGGGTGGRHAGGGGDITAPVNSRAEARAAFKTVRTGV